MKNKNVLDRRSFLAAAGGVAVGAAASGMAAEPGGRRPNIVFILADDMGYADLSCYGQPYFKTPVLDSLAQQGLRFMQGYANSAVCSATRTALVTGRYQYRFPSGLQEPLAASGSQGLPAGLPTMPAQFRAAGYRTALIGKWHVGTMPDFSPLRSGYDYFFGIPTGAADYFTHKGTAPDNPREGLWENEQRIDRDGYLTDLLADAAVAQIRAAEGQPFFVSLHFNAPHWPWEGPGDREISRSIKDIRHEDGGDLPTYARMVQSLDSAIGRVLAELQRRGLARDTIVVFTSDNGGERFSNTWPFTGTKGELLEGGLRVPLLMRWPGRLRAGQVTQQVVTSMDFLPTLLSAANVVPDPAFPSDGMNLWPVIGGAQAPVPRSLFWRFKANDQSAHRDGDFKYLRLGGKEHLFNVVQDPRERADLKSREAALFARLKAAYADWDRSMLPYPSNSLSEDVRQHYPDRY